jgi:hypothetical protein
VFDLGRLARLAGLAGLGSGVAFALVGADQESAELAEDAEYVFVRDSGGDDGASVTTTDCIAGGECGGGSCFTEEVWLILGRFGRSQTTSRMTGAESAPDCDCVGWRLVVGVLIAVSTPSLPCFSEGHFVLSSLACLCITSRSVT